MREKLKNYGFACSETGPICRLKKGVLTLFIILKNNKIINYYVEYKSVICSQKDIDKLQIEFNNLRKIVNEVSAN